MDVVVSGSSGLIGTALVARLTALGHRPIRLVRRSPAGDEVQWDPAAGTIDAASLEGIDAVVHLAGAGINISSLELSRLSQRGEAMMFVSVDSTVPRRVLDALIAVPGMRSVQVVELPQV